MQTKLRIQTIRLLNKLKQNPEYKNYVEVDVKPGEKMRKSSTKDK